jgi:2-oxoglutarate ferredoxin oxidoreductase subunit alpha
MEETSILVGGEAGQGSRKAGLLLGKILFEWGWQVFIYDDYQSLIRGGHNFSLMRASQKKPLAADLSLDLLLALDKKTVELHRQKLKEKGILVYSTSKISDVREGLGLPLEKWVKEAGGISLMENVALVGAVAKILGISWGVVEKVISEEFKPEVREKNLKVGYLAFGSCKTLFKIPRLKSSGKILLAGNEAIGLGLIRAGLNTYFAYPMTPTSGILHFLAEKQKEADLKVYQLESEIGVVNAALGAGFAGNRVAVGTSGGGFALMTEGLSFAAQAEIPLLIIEGQRTAPATGVPTYTAQSDLFFTLYAGHGDFLRFLIAPGDGEEAAFWAGEALNLAWEYQTPAILLVDKQICESTFTVEEAIFSKIKPRKPVLANDNGEYLRYKNTSSGISPLAFPGEKGKVVKVNGYEHDEKGLTVEDAKQVKKMQEKRLRKFQKMKEVVEKLPAVNIGGKKNSQTALVVWGSVKGVGLEVAEKRGLKLIQPVVLQPFPEKQMKKALEGVKKVIVAENNALGQLAEILPKYGVKVNSKILKYDGRPFWLKELDEKLGNIGN